MRRTLIATLLSATVLTACGAEAPDEATAPADDPAGDAGSEFPATVTDSGGEVTIDARPQRIVSLSPTHTEVLFAVGAGEQVVAVDDQSDHPDEAPVTDLSGFEPNLEAIAEEDPDLVVIAADPGELESGLQQLDIDVLRFDPATALDGAYQQWEQIGRATGNADAATQLVEETRTTIDELVAAAPDAAGGLTYYHELDENLFSATSSTFIGDVYGAFGLMNIADEAEDEGGGFPQLSEEFVLDADPDLIFLADAVYGQTPEVVAERPGWDALTAVQEGNLFEVDPDLSSRWGPRVVEFAELVADAVAAAS